MGTCAFERHYRVKELADLWGLSPKTVSRIFADEAGVVRIANAGTKKRKYETISIPESVASRVHERLGNGTLSETEEIVRPIRIIRLNELRRSASLRNRSRVRLQSS
jgi:AraC-like DNA-binding protein